MVIANNKLSLFNVIEQTIVFTIQNLTITKKNKFNLCQNGKGTTINACPRSAYFGSASP
jgi:hypothetical protein